MTSAPVSDAGSPPPAAPAASPGLSPPAAAERNHIKLTSRHICTGLFLDVIQKTS